MSKFENLFNTLLNEVGETPYNTSTSAPTSNGTPNIAPAPTANNTATGSANPANVGNTSNQQQPKPTAPKPGTPTSQPIVDPNHQAIKTIAGITDPNKLSQFLKDPKNGVQLVSTTNK